MRPISRRLILLAGAAPLAGCGALVPSRHREAVDISGLGAGKVLVVGRIELLPALRPSEQMPTADGAGEHAVLYLSTDLDAPRAPTADVLTPALDRLFLMPVALQRCCIAHALIRLDARVRRTGSATQEPHELWLPAPVRLDLRPGDAAVYVGTWRFWRDDWDAVQRAQVFDHQAAAEIELRRRFGAKLPLRKALAVLPGRGATRAA